MHHRGSLGLLFCVLLGCGGPPGTPSAATIADARPVLQEALDAWKAGQIPDLARRQPPIRFVDPDRESGSRLEDFRIGEGAVPIGPSWDVPVELTLRDRKGKSRTVNAVYQIATAPDLAVLRNDP